MFGWENISFPKDWGGWGIKNSMVQCCFENEKFMEGVERKYSLVINFERKVFKDESL